MLDESTLSVSVWTPGVASLLPLLPSLPGQVVTLSPATRARLEELELEGDLLEVSLDQSHNIHRVLHAHGVPPREKLYTLIQVRDRPHMPHTAETTYIIRVKQTTRGFQDLDQSMMLDAFIL